MMIPREMIADTGHCDLSLVNWPLYYAEAAASVSTSASCQDCPEDIGVLPVVEAELKLREIKREIFFAEVVEGSHDSSLEQAPKAFHIVRVDLAPHILMLAVRHGGVRQAEIVVRPVFIGCNQIDLLIDDLANESVVRLEVAVLHHLTDDIPLAADGTDGAALAEAETRPGLALLAALFVPMTVAILPADVGLINFNGSHKLRKGFVLHRRSDAMTHEPRGAIVAASDLAMNVKCADSFLGLAHQRDDFDPSLEWVVGVLEDRLRDDAEAVAVATAAILVLADPVEGARLQSIDFIALAAWTPWAVGPAHIAEQRLASVFGRIVALRLGQGDIRLSRKGCSSSNLRVRGHNIGLFNAGVKSNIIAHHSPK